MNSTIHYNGSNTIFRATRASTVILVGMPIPPIKLERHHIYHLRVQTGNPFTYLNSKVNLERANATSSIDPPAPLAMCVRVALTKTIALETGLGQIQRRYSFTLNNDTANYSETAKVRYIGYELPITALIFIRLGERAFMNAALGFSADFYPSDAQRDVERGESTCSATVGHNLA